MPRKTKATDPDPAMAALASRTAAAFRAETTEPAATDMLTDEAVAAIVAIPTPLETDGHLADCSLAKRGGPDATLACAYCGRARWMHRTRHDTCGSFSYVTESGITADQITALRSIPIAIPQRIRVSCARALNEFGGFSPVEVRDARRACAAAINTAKNRSADSALEAK